jgi:hypothetical protein
MQKSKSIYRTGVISVVIFSLILCSFTTGMVRQGALATPFQTLPPINATLATPIGVLTPVPTPMTTVVAGSNLIRVEGGSLIVGPNTYPIGDEFRDASGLPIGASTESMMGDFGYASINDIEDYKLLWITDKKGFKRYIIVDVSDPLFIGHKDVDDGFVHYLDKIRDAEEGMMWGLGGASGGLIAATVAQLLLCAPTAGTTCLSAIATALVGAIGGFTKLGYHYIFDYVPQMNNLVDQFNAIDTLRPKADS